MLLFLRVRRRFINIKHEYLEKPGKLAYSGRRYRQVRFVFPCMFIILSKLNQASGKFLGRILHLHSFNNLSRQELSKCFVGYYEACISNHRFFSPLFSNSVFLSFPRTRSNLACRSKDRVIFFPLNFIVLVWDSSLYSVQVQEKGGIICWNFSRSTLQKRAKKESALKRSFSNFKR